MSVGNLSTLVLSFVGHILSTLSILSFLFLSNADFVRSANAASIVRPLESKRAGSLATQLQSFFFKVPIEPATIERVELVYDALSARTSAGIRRSINGRAAFGGFLREHALGTSEVIEPIAADALRRGLNSVVFSPNAYGEASFVQRPRLQVQAVEASGKLVTRIIEPIGLETDRLLRPISWSDRSPSVNRVLAAMDVKERPKQAIDITYPLDGTSFGDRALVRGIVQGDATGSALTLTIGGRRVPHDLGMFEAIIERPVQSKIEGPGSAVGQAEWSVPIEASFADGRTISRTLTLTRSQREASLSEAPETTLSLRPEAPVQSAFGAKVGLADGGQEGLVSVRCNRFTETPESSDGLLNVTTGQCASYRIQRFGKTGPLSVELPARLVNLPKAFESKQARAFSYSERNHVWAALTESVVDLQNSSTVSTLREQSTTIVSGILKDDPMLGREPALWDQSTIQSLSQIDALSGHISIAPPVANPQGSARLILPIFMRLQRGKLGRLLQVSYDSSVGSGSIGQGWNLDVPTIAVDTKWGVPVYDAARETESYLFAGQELVAFAKDDPKTERPYLAPRMTPQDRNAFLKPDGTTEFRLRRDETYERFVRHGSAPGNYWWQVIRKDGVHEFYGYDPKNGSITDEAVRKTAGGAAFQWARTRVVDLDGHTAEYSWNSSTCGLIPGCVSTFKLQSLRYNKHLFANEGQASETQLNFTWSSSPRNDPSVNARHGIAQVMDAVLERITTSYGAGYSTFFAEQRFKFRKSTFGKTLLSEALYEAAPLNGSTITDAELIDHQCEVTPAKAWTLEEINKAGKTKRAICLRYHDPQNDKEPGAVAAAPFQDVKQVSSARVDNTKFDGAFGLVKGISAPLGSASILGTNTSKEMGASLYLGFSWPPAKEFSFGFKTGATERRSEGHSTLVDMTGDGVADLVQETGAGLAICEGKRTTTGSVAYETNCLMAQGVPNTISRENGSSFSLGAEAFLSAAFAGASFTDSSASRTTYFTDADGDGLTDIVDQGTVYFNRGRLGNTISFTQTSPNLKSLAAGGGAATIAGQISELGKSFDAQRGAAQKNRKYAPLIDLVQTWRAPFDGAIVLGGNFLSLAIPGDGSTGPDDTKGGARLAIERSRENAVKTCYSAPLSPGEAPLNCFETPGEVAAKPEDISSAIPAGQAAPLVMRVKAGDVIYARMSSTSDARTPWSDLDLYVSYISHDPAACKDTPGQRPFDCGARWARVGEVLRDVQAETDAAKKLEVLRSGLAQCLQTWPAGGAGNELDLSNPAKLCDATAHQPYYWSLAHDAVQAGQLTDITMLPQDGAAIFSASLSFPNGTAPLRITLASRAPPAAGDQQDLRLALEPADTLSLWSAKLFSLDVAGKCSGATYTGLPVPAPSRIECSPAGDRITVHLQSAGFAPGGQLARLEVREITDTTLIERRDSGALDWAALIWDQAPRVVVTPDAPVGNPPVNGIDPATLSQLSRVPSVITLSPYLRDRYLLDVQPDQIGAGTLRKLTSPAGQPPVYEDEPFNYGRSLLRGERSYIRAALGATPTKDFRSLIAGEGLDASKWKARGERFDPLIADNGFLLPGACPLGSNCTYEYRLAHVFSTLGPALTSGSADNAFAFDVDVLVNGKRVRLRNLGAIKPTGVCKGEDKNEELDPRRPVDCVVSGASTPPTPANGFPEQVGMSFALTDRNEVTGRDNAYAFDATPGDILQIQVRVRPLWNTTTSSYESCGNNACTPNRRKSRTIEKLHERACLNPNDYPGGCNSTDGPWLPLRLAEFRLGLNALETSFVFLKSPYGLNLAKETGDRRFDLVRLSAPISYSEHFERLKAAEPAYDHRGWSRFAVRASNYDDDGKVTGTFATPAFPRVRTENEFKRDKFDELVTDLQQKVNSASACNAGSPTCKQSLRDTAAKADTRNIYPLSMRFLDPVPSFTSAKAWCDAFGATNPGICQSWLKPETHGQQADLPPTCGRPLIGTIVPCFIGPNEKIWIKLPTSTASKPTIRLASAHRGPEELGLTESAYALDAIKRMTPTATSILAPPFASTTSSWAATLGFSGANGGILTSHSSNQSYYMDLNGDGYPDPVINGVAFLTGPNGLPRADWLAAGQLSGIAKSSDFNQLSLGGGNATTAISAPYANGSADSTQSPAGDASRGPQISEARVNPVGQAAGPEARLAGGFGLTFALGNSVPDDDLIDLNGDGLPDAVKINGDQLYTRLNIGNQFAGAGALDARKPLGGVDVSGSLGFNLGWKTASGSFGGGMSISRNNSMSRATLIDMNGDGLVDSVLPDGNGKLDVAFNNGWGFEPSISIPVPDFKFPDTGASETMIAGIGGHFSWFAGPLCWPTPFCFAVINPAFSKTDTLGRNLMSMLDLNGDGLVDFASTEGFYQGGSLLAFPSGNAERNLRVHLNGMGKADKLKTIINPTGTTVGLDYALFGSDSIRNPKAIWGLSEVRVTDGFRTANAESEDQDILITQVRYDDGVHDRAERRFLGFGKMVIELRGCADARTPLLSSVALSGRCAGAPAKFLRRLVKRFDTQSIYTSGLLLEDIVTLEDEGKIVHLTSFAYSLSPAPPGSPSLAGLQDPYAVCDADTAKLATQALDDICLAVFRQRLGADIQTRGVNALDTDGNPSNHGRWAGLHLSPQLKVVRKNVREGGSLSLRSLILNDHDALGNVVAMVDFGHVRNPNDAQDDSRDDFRVDISYTAITPVMDKINGGLTGKLDPSKVFDRAATIIARQGAKLDRGAKVLRARSAVYDPQGAGVTAQCRLLANDVQPEELASNFCADLAATPLKGSDPANQFDAATRKAGFAPEDVILSRIFRDVFGNPVRTITPFNHRGDWIETRLNYERDPFRMNPSMIGEAHCLYRPGGPRPPTMSTRSSVNPSDICTFEGAPRSSNVLVSAWHVSSAAYEPHGGTKSWDSDINRNTVFYERDGWGRLRSVLSSWDQLDADTSFIAVESRMHYSAMKVACAANTAMPCPTTIMMHLSYQDHRLDSESPWQARTARYVDGSLYEGHSTQFVRTVEAVSFVDGLNRSVRMAKSADVCDDKTIDDQIEQHGSINYGWCATNAVRLAVSSGKIVRNALGEMLAEYYPWSLALNAAAVPVFKGFTTNKYLDWNFVNAAPANLPKVTRQLDAVGRPSAIVTPDGNRTQVDHAVVSDVNNGGIQTRFKTSVVNPRCTFTQYRRDARGLIVRALEDQAAFFRDAAHPSDDVDASGRSKAWCLTPQEADAAVLAAKPGEVEKPDATLRFSETRYVYDAMSQLTDVIVSRRIGAETGRIRIAYDNLGRRIRLADPDRGTENIQFDRMGNVRLRDYTPLQGSGTGQSKSILQEFDANRLVATRYPASPQLDMRYRYDSFTGFDFKDWQPVDAKAARVLADQIGESCDNCVGRVIATQDRAGLVTQDYDVFGQPKNQWKSFLVDRSEKGRFNVRKEYDRWGLLKLQQVQELEPQSGNTLCFASNPRRFVCDLNETVRYGYNRTGQLHRIDHESNTVARFAYDAFGAIGAKWTSDGTTTRYIYGGVDRRLTTVAVRLSDGTAVQNTTYNYDSGGNISGYTNSAGVTGAEYLTRFGFNYDAANRITAFSGQIKDDVAGVNLTVAPESYSYDTLHRLKSLKVGSIESQYRYVDDMDVGVQHPLHAPRLIETGPNGSSSRSTLHYDDWGNLAKTNRIGASGTLEEQRVLRWDAENRLSALTVTREGAGGAARETVEADYTYDSGGARAIKVAPRLGDTASTQQKEVNFNVSEVLTRRWNENTAGLHFSAGGMRVGCMRLARTSQGTERFIYFYHSELPNGSITAVTRPVGGNAYEGEVIERLEYRPYGSVVPRKRMIGPIATGTPAVSDKLAMIAGDQTADRRLPFYAYSGKEIDLESGYLYFGARYYDPEHGIWLNADPKNAGVQKIGSPINSYAYVNNNPLLFVDKRGLDAENSWGIFGFVSFSAGGGPHPVEVGGEVVKIYGYDSKEGWGNSTIVAGGVSAEVRVPTGKLHFAHYEGIDFERGGRHGISLDEVELRRGKFGIGTGKWQSHTGDASDTGPFYFFSGEIGPISGSIGVGGAAAVISRLNARVSDWEYDMLEKMIGEERLSKAILSIGDAYEKMTKGVMTPPKEHSKK